jgi:DUF4097 and DUF4098 domain-containing protein YvlB
MRIESVITLALLAAAATVCNAADRDFEKKVETDPHGSVQISNVSGSVTVTGWDRPEVEVKGHLGDGVDRVDVVSAGGRTTIKVVLPTMSSRDGEATLIIRVPQESELDVTAVSADLVTSGMMAAQRLKTVSGDIRAELTKAEFEGKTVSGDMRLRGNSKEADIRLQSISGDITLDRGAGDIEATTVSGDLRLELDPARSVRMRTTSGDLTFRGTLIPTAILDAETISGDATLNARATAGYEYEATSFSGDLDNCFGKQAESTSRHGPGSRLMGTTGEGKARVRVKSMSGDVDLCNR